MALKILKAGDVRKLLTLSESSSLTSETSSYVTPDKILEYLIPAKNKEIKRYPITKSYGFKSETTLPPQKGVIEKD